MVVLLEKKFVCKECNKSFGSASNLKRHKKNVHGGGTFFMAQLWWCEQLLEKSRMLCSSGISVDWAVYEFFFFFLCVKKRPVCIHQPDELTPHDSLFCVSAWAMPRALAAISLQVMHHGIIVVALRTNGTQTATPLCRDNTTQWPCVHFVGIAIRASLCSFRFRMTKKNEHWICVSCRNLELWVQTIWDRNTRFQAP